MRKVLVVLLALTFAIAPILTFVQPVQAAPSIFQKLVPTGAGAYNLDQLSGAPTQWQACSDNSTATYAYANPSTSDNATFVMGDILGTPVIYGIRIVNLLHSGGAAGMTAYTLMRIGATNYFGSGLAIPAAWTACSTTYTVNPSTGTSWTISDINALEAGASITCGTTGWLLSDTWIDVLVNITAPVITTDAASAISTTTARLNATVTDSGGQLADVQFVCDNATNTTWANYLADNGTAGHDVHFSALVSDNYTTGDHPYADITGLNLNQTYYFIPQITNDNSTVIGSELSFLTASGITKPTNISVIPASTSISLSWTKGSGALYTLARYKLAAYPATNIDGTSAYLGTSNSVSITGLTPGLTYYISLWGFTGGTYSTDYATGMGTTLAYDAPGTGTGNAIEVPADGGTFTQTPSTVHVANVPFHEAIESISTAYGTPLNMVWYVIWMMAGIAGGILLYNRAGQGGQASYNLPMTFGAEAIWFGIGASIGLTMMWVVVLFLIVATGFTMFGNRH
jgi:hypothetical protein